MSHERLTNSLFYSFFEKGRKNVHSAIRKGSMGYQYTVPDTVAVGPTCVTFLPQSRT